MLHTTPTPTAPTEDTIAAILAQNRTAIFAYLQQHAVDTLTVTYGEDGGRGYIEEMVLGGVGAFSETDTIAIMENKIGYIHAHPQISPHSQPGDRIHYTSEQFDEVMGRFCLDIIQRHHGDWTRFRDTTGTLVFTVATQTIALTHKQARTEYDIYQDVL